MSVHQMQEDMLMHVIQSRGQKRTLNLMELDLQMVISCFVGHEICTLVLQSRRHSS